jgi:hypothetical protein
MSNDGQSPVSVPDRPQTPPATGSPARSAPRWKQVAILAARALAVLVLVCSIAWASAAIWFDGPHARWLAAILAAALPLACIAAFAYFKRFRISLPIGFGLFAVVLVWWFTLAPRNDRAWQPDVAHPARAAFVGNTVTIQNIRNFEYRSNDDFTEHWESRTFNLSQVVGLDLFLSFWGPTMIAHTIASWEFSDGRHLAISIETRKEVGEEYSAIGGFFRQFEIYYVVADERDLIGLRAAHRGEHIYLYRMNATPDVARAVLVDYLETINSLAARPQWYNALTDNCTTAIRYHFSRIGTVRSFSWKLLLNGYLDELLYERGQIDTSVPFDELKRRSDITDRARAAAADPDFSRRIRTAAPASQP